MVDILKKAFYSYQKCFFYVNTAKGEYAKIGSFIPETLMILTYLKLNGVSVKVWQIPLFYLGLILIAGVGGWILAERIGVQRLNNTIGNEHNEQITEILTRIRKL